MQTPWGLSQECTSYGDGLVFISTASHGGFYVSRELLAQMPEYFRRYDGWYEEDCEWAIVVVQASSSYWVSMLDDFSLNQRDVAFLLKPLGERELLYWQDSATMRRISIAQSGWRG